MRKVYLEKRCLSVTVSENVCSDFMPDETAESITNSMNEFMEDNLELSDIDTILQMELEETRTNINGWANLM